MKMAKLFSLMLNTGMVKALNTIGFKVTLWTHPFINFGNLLSYMYPTWLYYCRA
jgi:hypothetical protein